MYNKIEKGMVNSLINLTLLCGMTLGVPGCSNQPEDPVIIAKKEAKNRAIRIGGDLPLTVGKVTFIKAMSQERTVIINAEIKEKNILQLDALASKAVTGLCNNKEVMDVLTLGVDYKLVFFNETGIHLSEVVVNQQSCS